MTPTKKTILGQFKCGGGIQPNGLGLKLGKKGWALKKENGISKNWVGGPEISSALFNVITLVETPNNYSTSTCLSTLQFLLLNNLGNFLPSTNSLKKSYPLFLHIFYPSTFVLKRFLKSSPH